MEESSTVEGGVSAVVVVDQSQPEPEQQRKCKWNLRKRPIINYKSVSKGVKESVAQVSSVGEDNGSGPAQMNYPWNQPTGGGSGAKKKERPIDRILNNPKTRVKMKMSIPKCVSGNKATDVEATVFVNESWLDALNQTNVNVDKPSDYLMEALRHRKEERPQAELVEPVKKLLSNYQKHLTKIPYKIFLVKSLKRLRKTGTAPLPSGLGNGGASKGKDGSQSNGNVVKRTRGRPRKNPIPSMLPISGNLRVDIDPNAKLSSANQAPERAEATLGWGTMQSLPQSQHDGDDGDSDLEVVYQSPPPNPRRNQRISPSIDDPNFVKPWLSSLPDGTLGMRKPNDENFEFGAGSLTGNKSPSCPLPLIVGKSRPSPHLKKTRPAIPVAKPLVSDKAFKNKGDSDLSGKAKCPIFAPLQFPRKTVLPPIIRIPSQGERRRNNSTGKSSTQQKGCTTASQLVFEKSAAAISRQMEKVINASGLDLDRQKRLEANFVNIVEAGALLKKPKKVSRQRARRAAVSSGGPAEHQRRNVPKGTSSTDSDATVSISSGRSRSRAPTPSQLRDLNQRAEATHWVCLEPDQLAQQFSFRAPPPPQNYSETQSQAESQHNLITGVRMEPQHQALSLVPATSSFQSHTPVQYRQTQTQFGFRLMDGYYMLTQAQMQQFQEMWCYNSNAYLGYQAPPSASTGLGPPGNPQLQVHRGPM